MSETPHKFGIGCFHFGLKSNKTEILLDQYFSELENALQQIKGLSIIQIRSGFDPLKIGVPAISKMPRLNQGTGYFPDLMGSIITFNLFIPKKIQNKLLDNLVFIEPLSENFRITMSYPYYSPVTFIEPIDNHLQEKPSNSVIIVREYLKKQLSLQNDSNITFEYLGPSPFHFDCWVSKFVPTKEMTDYSGISKTYFSKIEKNINGYNGITFFRRPIREEVVDNYPILFLEVEDEMSLFYINSLDNISRLNSWSDIESILKKVELSDKNNIIWIAINRALKTKNIKSVIRKSLKYKNDEIIRKAHFQNSLRRLYDNREKGHFRDYLFNAKDEFNYLPINNVLELMYQYHDWIKTSTTYLVTIMASIIGGVIGFILSNIFSQF